MGTVEQLPSRYFVTASNFISKEYFECCPIKYAPPYSDSFIISSVYYKGSISGFVDELHITPTKRWTSLPPRNCTVCGVEYVAGSAISKYCPKCREKIRKTQGTETKRRSRDRNRAVCIELSAKNNRLVSDARPSVIFH